MPFFPSKKSQAHDFQLSGQTNLFNPIPISTNNNKTTPQTKMSSQNQGRQSPPPEEQSGAQQQDAPSKGTGVNTETDNKEESKSQLEVFTRFYYSYYPLPISNLYSIKHINFQIPIKIIDGIISLIMLHFQRTSPQTPKAH